MNIFSDYIFLDNASTTKCSEKAIEICGHFLRVQYFNPSASYCKGLDVRNHIGGARTNLLKHLKGDGNLIFCSSGTEASNSVLFGAKKPKGCRIIVSNLEHAATYYPAKKLKEQGYDVVFCKVDEHGKIDIEDYKKALNDKVALVSVIHVSNETGAINNIKELCMLAKQANPNCLFHADGTQAFCKIPVNLRNVGLDFYTISAHKLYAPKGIGALFIKKGVILPPFILGGGQEGGLRSSTENTSGIMAFSVSADETMEQIEKNAKKATELKEIIVEYLKNHKEIKILSPPDGSPFILSFSSSKVRGEVMQHALEKQGILIGIGSACTSNKATRRIPEALSLQDSYQYGIMRISFGRQNTVGEIQKFITAFDELYKELKQYGTT